MTYPAAYFSSSPSSTASLPAINPWDDDPRFANIQPGYARVKFQIHDKPPVKGTTEKLFLNITNTEIIPAADGEEPITVMTEPLNIDILTITADDPKSMGFLDIPAGDYEQIRMITDDQNYIVIDGVKSPIKLPSGENTGWKLNPVDGVWHLSEGCYSVFDIDFDPATQVVQKGNGELSLKPTVPVVVTEICPPDIYNVAFIDYISYANGGTIRLGDDVSLYFPPGSLTQDTWLSIKKNPAPLNTLTNTLFFVIAQVAFDIFRQNGCPFIASLRAVKGFILCFRAVEI